MTTVRALRGVCIGVDRHLAAGDIAEIDAGQFPFLRSIGAVEEVNPPPAEAARAEPTPTPPPAADAQQATPATPVPASGKKEK